ncbi:uncharacterized protein [Triticum aestivum]|uniref:uncharacterized protein isoform X1 n=1 Tax=Triticum aestivum TaxID=4565 RepID=UPI000843CB14|nr:uncharacterized protein LOC123139881 isoform X1 [Triticum aestivum]
MLPKLKDHSFYQLTQGNISIWSTPWCSLWASIHDHLIIQEPGFMYPSLVRDLWLPGQKAWNSALVNSLFQHPLASVILQTDIIYDDGPDLLCWDLSSNGICSSKSAYKFCLQEIHENPMNAPSSVSLEVKDLLKLIWKQKQMLPRVKTFAWRLFRKALPTGLRAGHFSTHISQACCRCGKQEDEFHLFFLCDFARAAWFSSPWFIRSDVLVQGHTNLHSSISTFLRMSHPHVSIENILNFLWCLWKAKNDFLFDRKKALPHHVHIVAKAFSYDLYDVSNHMPSLQEVPQVQLSPNQLPLQGKTLKSDLLVLGPKIYSDAAFRCKKVPGLVQGSVATGVGIYLSWPQDQIEVNVQIQASAPATSSPIQAEAFALSFAAHLANRLNIMHPTFLMDCLSLASLAAPGEIVEANTPWSIRKLLGDFFKQVSNLQPEVFHISREINGIAHNVAHQDLCSNVEPEICCFPSAYRHISCPVVSLLHTFQVQGFVIHAVRC